MQFVQAAQAEELQKITQKFPEVVNKLDMVNEKLDAMLEVLGYEVKLKAVKKSDANIHPN